jgi:hypothetical protein
MPRQRRSQPRATIKEEPPIEDATTKEEPAIEDAPMKEEPPMEDVKKTPAPIEFVGKTVETMALWADANQRILSQLVELGAGAAKESTRLYTELQQTTVEVLRDTQATALRWQTLWPEAFKDPASVIAPRTPIHVSSTFPQLSTDRDLPRVTRSRSRSRKKGRSIRPGRA